MQALGLGAAGGQGAAPDLHGWERAGKQSRHRPQHGHLTALAAKEELGGVQKNKSAVGKEPIQQGDVPEGCDLGVNALLGTAVTSLDSQADNTFVYVSPRQG